MNKILEVLWSSLNNINKAGIGVFCLMLVCSGPLCLLVAQSYFGYVATQTQLHNVVVFAIMGSCSYLFMWGIEIIGSITKNKYLQVS